MSRHAVACSRVRFGLGLGHSMWNPRGFCVDPRGMCGAQ